MNRLQTQSEPRRRAVADERMRAVTHRAGYIAFLVAVCLFWIISVVDFYVLDDDTAGVLAVVGFMVPLLVHFILLARGGAFATQRDEVNRSAETRRRAILGTMIGGATFGAFFFTWSYWISSQPFGDALLQALIAIPLFMGFNAFILLRRNREE